MSDTFNTGGSPFPQTQWSMVLRAGAGDGGTDTAQQERMQELLRAYWKPVYAMLRRVYRMTPDDAADAAQDFFLAMLQRDFLKNLQREGGAFRAFLRTALRRFMTDQARRRNAQKREVQKNAVSLNVEEMEGRLADPKAPATDDIFDREWRRTVLEAAGARVGAQLAAAGKPVYDRVFRMYLDGQLRDDPAVTYRSIAESLGITEGDVRNFLHRTRRKLQDEVVEVLKESVSTEDELAGELRDLFAS